MYCENVQVDLLMLLYPSSSHTALDGVTPVHMKCNTPAAVHKVGSQLEGPSGQLKFELVNSHLMIWVNPDVHPSVSLAWHGNILRGGPCVIY